MKSDLMLLPERSYWTLVDAMLADRLGWWREGWITRFPRLGAMLWAQAPMKFL